MKDEVKEMIFSVIQTFLKNPPVIVWGSGATVPFGLPTMEKLNDVLKDKISNFNSTNKNLEVALDEQEDKSQMKKIRKTIWDAINTVDCEVHRKMKNAQMNGLIIIKTMIEKFRETNSQVVNIVTTNYDCILENVMAFYNIPFTDGFNGREFSSFNEENFKDKNITNLIKVHGSINWFQVCNSIRYLKQNSDNEEPAIILPCKNKYQESYQTPYRELIQKSDDLIKHASSFLVVGFGFNDEHLTPRIKEKVNNGTPLVLITKEVTQSCKKELKHAQKNIFLQKNESDKTSVEIKNGKDKEINSHIVDGNYWQLNKFMEVL